MSDVRRSTSFRIQNTGWTGGSSWFDGPDGFKTPEDAANAMFDRINALKDPECFFRVVKTEREWSNKRYVLTEEYGDPYRYGDEQ